MATTTPRHVTQELLALSQVVTGARVTVPALDLPRPPPASALTPFTLTPRDPGEGPPSHRFVHDEPDTSQTTVRRLASLTAASTCWRSMWLTHSKHGDVPE